MTIEKLEKANKLIQKIESAKHTINELDFINNKKCTICIKTDDSSTSIQIPEELQNIIIGNIREFCIRREKVAYADFNML